MLRHLISRFLADVSGELLRTTAKSAAIAALFSVGVAYYLSERLDADKKTLERLAAATSQDRKGSGGGGADRPGIDMTLTGSIVSPAKVDPCATPAKR